MNKKLLGDLGLILTALMWGFGFVVTHATVQETTPLQLISIRFTLASVFFLVFFSKHLKNMSKQTIMQGCILGAVLFLGFYLQTVGIQYTTPSKNAFLTTTNVVFVPFIVFFLFREKIDKYSIIGTILTIIGIALLTLNGDFGGFSKGDFLSLACGLAFAFHIVLTGHFSKTHENPMQLAIVQLIATAIISTIIMLIVDGMPHDLSKKAWSGLIFLSFFGTFMGFTLQTVCQKLTTETRAAIILSTESLFGTVFSVIFVGEILTPKMIAGIVLMFSAVIITQIPTFKSGDDNNDNTPSDDSDNNVSSNDDNNALAD